MKIIIVANHSIFYLYIFSHQLFVKHYSKLMKDFIQDDNEHSLCVVSLGVQIFTMPTIAHLLIAEEAVVCKLIITFIGECHTRIING